MSLSRGTRLGIYEILSPIGAGGMGEVFRARDTRLDREVAIKILPAALARDPERLTRFEREAKTLASLNHPNIAQIYGLEEWDGSPALVMELIRGESIPLRVDVPTAIGYARQIAAALETSHSSGIVHRDLKPANIGRSEFRYLVVWRCPVRDVDRPVLVRRRNCVGYDRGSADARSRPERAAYKCAERGAVVAGPLSGA